MARRGIHEGDLVRVQSRRGALHVIAAGDEEMRSGQVYLPMHWGKRFLGGQASEGVNTVTNPAFDAHSRQPELKHTAVKVTGVELPWRVVAFAEIEPDRVAATFDAMQALQEDVVFTSAVLIGRDRPGILFRAAHEAAPGTGWIATLDELLDLHGGDVLRYEDTRRALSRRVRILDDRLLGVRLTGEAGAIASGEWLREWLVSAKPVAEIRRLLLSPATHAPSGFMMAGRVICQCFNVCEPEIAACLANCAGDAQQKLEALRAELKCGTNCGSCVPELRSLAGAIAVNIAGKAGRMVA
jgi:assimilatory nitrate reductase catalytic subunit